MYFNKRNCLSNLRNSRKMQRRRWKCFFTFYFFYILFFCVFFFSLSVVFFHSSENQDFLLSTWNGWRQNTFQIEYTITATNNINLIWTSALDRAKKWRHFSAKTLFSLVFSRLCCCHHRRRVAVLCFARSGKVHWIPEQKKPKHTQQKQKENNHSHLFFWSSYNTKKEMDVRVQWKQHEAHTGERERKQAAK